MARRKKGSHEYLTSLKYYLAGHHWKFRVSNCDKISFVVNGQSKSTALFE